MILLINWPSHSQYGLAIRNHLSNLGAALIEKQVLTGCIAAVPQQEEDRSWFYTYLNSLQRSGVQRVNAIVPDTDALSRNIAECEQAGLQELVILQNENRPLDIPPGKAGIRIWFNHDVSGNFQRYICSLKRAITHLRSIEISPFMFEQSTLPLSVKLKDPVISPQCDWSRAILTVSGTGTIIQAPVNRHGSSNLSASAHGCTIGEYVRNWKGKFHLYPLCISCNSMAVMNFPEWIYQPDYSISSAPAPTAYIDHARGDVKRLPEEEQKALVAGFLNRARLAD